MKTRQDDHLRTALVIMALGAIIAFGYAIRGAFAVLTISIIIYYMLDPIATGLEGRTFFKRITVNRLAAVIVAFLAGILIITLFFVVLIPPIMDQVERFTRNIPEYTKQAEHTFDDLLRRFRQLELPSDVQDGIRQSIEKVATESSVVLRHTVRGAAHFFNQIMLILMIPFITFYLLLEKHAVKETIVRMFPRRHQQEASVVLTQSSAALRGYIIGQLVLSLIMGVVMTAALVILGVKAPLLLGIIAGITKMIPVIGIFIGCIPAAFVALSSSFSLAMWVVVVFTVIQLLENKVILPVMLSKYVSLSPLSILLSILVGEQLGGVMGMFLATPLFAVIRVLYIHVRAKYD